MFVILGSNGDLGSRLVTYLQAAGEDVVSCSRKRSGPPGVLKHITSEIAALDVAAVAPKHSILVPAFGMVGINFSERQLLEVIKVNFTYVAYLAAHCRVHDLFIVFPSSQRASVVEADEATVDVLSRVLDAVTLDVLGTTVRSEADAASVSARVLCLLRDVLCRHNVYDLTKLLVETLLSRICSANSASVRIGNMYGSGLRRGVFSRVYAALTSLDDAAVVEQQRVIYPVCVSDVCRTLHAAGLNLRQRVGKPFIQDCSPRRGWSVAEIAEAMERKFVPTGRVQLEMAVNEKVWQKAAGYTEENADRSDELHCAFVECEPNYAKHIAYADLVKNVLIAVAIGATQTEVCVYSAFDRRLVHEQTESYGVGGPSRPLGILILEVAKARPERIDLLLFTCAGEELTVEQTFVTALLADFAQSGLKFAYLPHSAVRDAVPAWDCQTAPRLTPVSAGLRSHLLKIAGPPYSSRLQLYKISREIESVCTALEQGFSDAWKTRVRRAFEILFAAFGVHADTEGIHLIQHSIAIAEQCKGFTGITDPTLVVSAIVHDIVEHSDTDPERVSNYLGPQVAQIAMLLSQDKNRAMGAHTRLLDLELLRSHCKRWTGGDQSDAALTNVIIKHEHFCRLLNSGNETALLLKVIDNHQNYSHNRFRVNVKPRSAAEIVLFAKFLDEAQQRSEAVRSYVQAHSHQLKFILQHHYPAYERRLTDFARLTDYLAPENA